MTQKLARFVRDQLSAASNDSRGTRPELGYRTRQTGKSGQERRGGGVFGSRDSSYQTRRQRIAQALWFTEMTAVEVLGSVDELAAGTGGSIDAVTGAAICPYWKSRSREI